MTEFTKEESKRHGKAISSFFKQAEEELFTWTRCGCDPSKLTIDGYKISCNVHKMSWPILESQVIQQQKEINSLKEQLTVMEGKRDVLLEKNDVLQVCSEITEDQLAKEREEKEAEMKVVDSINLFDPRFCLNFSSAVSGFEMLDKRARARQMERK